MTRDMIPDGTNDGAGGVAGDDSGGRRFAIPHRAAVGMNFYDHIFHAADSAQRSFERSAQGNGDSAQPDLGNYHGITFFQYYLAGRTPAN